MNVYSRMAISVDKDFCSQSLVPSDFPKSHNGKTKHYNI